MDDVTAALVVLVALSSVIAIVTCAVACAGEPRVRRKSCSDTYTRDPVPFASRVAVVQHKHLRVAPDRDCYKYDWDRPYGKRVNWDRVCALCNAKSKRVFCDGLC